MTAATCCMSGFGRELLLRKEPEASKYLRRFVGAEEFLNGIERWCLWLEARIRRSSGGCRAVMDCVHAVAIHRKKQQAADHEGAGRSCRPASAKFASRTAAICSFPRCPASAAVTFPSDSCAPTLSPATSCFWSPAPTLSFRGLVFRHAHGLGAAGGRAVGVAIPLLQQDRLQQLSLARRADRGTTRPRQGSRPADPGSARGTWRRTSRLPSRRERRAARPLAWPTFTTERACRCRSTRPTPRWTAPWIAATAAQPFTSDRQRVEFLFALYERLVAPLIPATGKGKRQRDRRGSSAG